MRQSVCKHVQVAGGLSVHQIIVGEKDELRSSFRREIARRLPAETKAVIATRLGGA